MTKKALTSTETPATRDRLAIVGGFHQPADSAAHGTQHAAEIRAASTDRSIADRPRRLQPGAAAHQTPPAVLTNADGTRKDTRLKLWHECRGLGQR